MNMFENRLYQRLQYEKSREVMCKDEKYTYYKIVLDGFVLTYKQTTLRPDGRRLYKVDDNLASYLGYKNVYWMIKVSRFWQRRGERGLKFYKGYVTPQTLQKCFSDRRWKAFWDWWVDGNQPEEEEWNKHSWGMPEWEDECYEQDN